MRLSAQPPACRPFDLTLLSGEDGFKGIAPSKGPARLHFNESEDPRPIHHQIQLPWAISPVSREYRPSGRLKCPGCKGLSLPSHLMDSRHPPQRPTAHRRPKDHPYVKA
jgi:hypothetical protein